MLGFLEEKMSVQVVSELGWVGLVWVGLGWLVGWLVVFFGWLGWFGCFF